MNTKYLIITMFFLSLKITSKAQLESKNLLLKFKKGFDLKEQEDSLSNIASKYLNDTQNKRTYDSLNQKILELYPKGNTAALNQLLKINEKSQTGNLRIAEINEFKKNYPDVKYENPNSTLGYYYNTAVIHSFPSFIETDSTATMSLIATLNSSTLNNIAWSLKEKSNHLIIAERISKLALDKLNSETNDNAITDKQSKLSRDNALAKYETTYSIILSNLGRKKEALSHIAIAIKNTKSPNSTINSLYLTLLNDNGLYTEAVQEGSKIYVKGNEDDDFLKQINIAYNKSRREKEWNIYLDSLTKEKIKVYKQQLANSLINKPVENFTLKDLNGNSVSLSDYKGKIVVLDFWATWCGPCKKSFPGMQMAVDKYKNKSDVVFLFIDTWENNTTPLETKMAVSNFIKTNQYRFHVLLDKKKNGKNEFEVGDTFKEKFGMKGIPTKFFIGKDGKVKLMMVGYAGSDQKVLEEVSLSIDYLLENA